jgi:uncharacterized protein
MLGQARDSLTISARGAAGDRVWALLDRETNKVASAKRPKLWRGLLRCLAHTREGHGDAAVEVQLPDGTTAPAGDPPHAVPCAVLVSNFSLYPFVA